MKPALKFYSAKKHRDRPEARLQKTVVQICALSCHDDVLWHSVPNEGARTASFGHELKMMGLLPGAGDMIFVIKGRTHYLELKALGEKQSQPQKDFEAAAIRAGAVYRVADNIDDAVATLVAWKALRPNFRFQVVRKVAA